MDILKIEDCMDVYIAKNTVLNSESSEEFIGFAIICCIVSLPPPTRPYRKCLPDFRL